MCMEKRNVIEDGRTPNMPKQADADEIEHTAAKMFIKGCNCENCDCCTPRKEVTDVA